MKYLLYIKKPLLE